MRQALGRLKEHVTERLKQVAKKKFIKMAYYCYLAKTAFEARHVDHISKEVLVVTTAIFDRVVKKTCKKQPTGKTAASI